MTPIEIQHATRAFGKPADWDEERRGPCDTLPIRDTFVGDAHVMQSAWRPSVDEIAAMIAGHPVVLTIFGRQHPAVSLHVEVPGG